jgi:pimeloyl-ACP methyl ester carboxylesterase
MATTDVLAGRGVLERWRAALGSFVSERGAIWHTTAAGSIPKLARRCCLAALALVLAAIAVVFPLESAQAQAQAGCPAGSACGTVTVPLDRTDPSGATIDIAYELLPHTDTSQPALGTILPNPGGPGNSTTAFAPYKSAFAPLRARRDVLLVDARGTGRSGALSCPGLARPDPLSIDKATIGTVCAADMGARAGLFGSAAVADDFDAVRAALGIDKLDLWGDSYGTFLMPVYAARYPEHVRSIVLDGAFPIAADPWGRDVLRGVRRVIGLVCRRTQRCSGRRVLAGVQRLGARLREHPRTFAAHSPVGLLKLALGERELAAVTYAGGDPTVYGLLPAAVEAALDHDYALLERLVFASRAADVQSLMADPAQLSIAIAAATSCHDYPRPYDLAAPPADRRAQYRSALAALDRAQFRPLSPAAWLSTGIDAGPQCVDWPADPTAGSPLQGRPLPDVPVLVQSGDLDSNTPVEQGRVAAAQFPHATFAVVANAGHTPDAGACGQAMALDFIEHLRTDRARCSHVGRPPTVIDRPARQADQLPAVPVHAPTSVRRAVAVALATMADARMAAASSGLGGTLDALRGGTYVLTGPKVRFVGASVVSDAVVDGVQRGARAHLRMHGRGVPTSRLTLRSSRRVTRVTGTVAGRQVALRVQGGGHAGPSNP